MANTYAQIYLHVVFAVSQRACVIGPSWREQLQKYITGIVTGNGQKLIAIDCMPDHVHILLGLKPDMASSDLIRDIKAGSTNHIGEQKWVGCRFSWQEGFGAFSVREKISNRSSITFKTRRRIMRHPRSRRSISRFSISTMWNTTSDMCLNRSKGYMSLLRSSDCLLRGGYKRVAPNGASGREAVTNWRSLR